jgi:hypothetical protein
MTFALAACGDSEQGERTAEETVQTNVSFGGSTDAFGEMMNEGAQSQVEQRPRKPISPPSPVSRSRRLRPSKCRTSCAWRWRTLQSLKKVSTALPTETGVSVEVMTRVAERPVQYRCPELTNK